MTNSLLTLRFIATAGLALLGGAPSLAADQGGDAEAIRAAEAAQLVVEDAQGAIRAIDPTTGEPMTIDDPAMVDPAMVDPAMVDRGADAMPELPQVAAISGDEAPSRGPAARMISNPVVQDVPASSPAPAAARIANADPFRVNSILEIPPGPFRYGDWYWDESGAPAKGKLVVTVDLEARVVSVFRDGHEIGTAVALLGTTKHPTPLGSFPILTKEKDNISEKYNNTPMPWTLRLTWDGIAIHGSPVINGFASHGCIGVPDEFAEQLFAAAKRGDRVIISRGRMIDVGDKIVS
ncbi:MAG: L,D-transpeptidase family protein [Erythrobacter sp.]|jgi:lipoprotein-anchoring transpeptidase ErfK/SrfK|nr:L,D-transpeptidase family protein [Erythrobacter sp.]